MKKSNPESAVLSALDSERETLRLSKYVMNLGWEIDEGKKKRRTMPAQTANRRKKRKKIGLLVDIMKSRGHTPISIDRKRNEKMLVFSLLNKELKKQRKKEISKPTYHLYLKELRENSFNDAPENN